MKLRHQGALLLAIPLVFQFGSVVMLLGTLIQIESVAKQEERAKQIVSLCDEIKLTGISTYMRMLAAQVFERKRLVSLVVASRPQIAARFEMLKQLAAGDSQELQLIKKYQDESMHFQTLLEDGAEAFSGELSTPTFAQFLTDKEYLEEVFDTTGRIVEAARLVSARYSTLAGEFQPREQERRKTLETLIVAALIGNVIVVVILALIYARRTMRKFDQLVTNIRSFSKGRKEFAPVTGNDELSELDQAFRASADARIQAEDARTFIINMVSHDLRTPLTAVSATLQLVDMGVYGDVTELVASKLALATRQLDHLLVMLDDFLDTEKLQSGEFNVASDAVTIEPIVQEAWDALKVLAEAKTVSLAQTPQLPPSVCTGDMQRIRQVLVNLLSNAVKYSPDGSTISVKTFDLSGIVRTEITDQGPGIDAQYQDAIFDRFVQVPSKSQQKSSSGLGLAICKALIGKQGGRIGISSSPGAGSTFWFELPAWSQSSTEK